MKAGEISSLIENYAPLGLQESWDNSGYAVGNAQSEVSSLLLGFDCTPELVDEAIAVGADMIVTHHPLIFGGVKKISDADDTGRAIIKAIKHDIVIYACHTNMDKVVGGVSGTLAAKIGLVNVRVLDADAEGNGLGVIGELPEAQNPVDYLKWVKSVLGLEIMRSSRPLPHAVKTVAICGGSGRSLIGKAVAAGADLYITGDVSYHDFYTPEGFMIADIGHYESEADILPVIRGIVSEKFPTFAVRIGAKSINPVYYYR